MIDLNEIEDEEIPAVLTKLAARLHAMTLRAKRPDADGDGDRLISIDDAALRLNVSRSWIYQRSRSLPFIVRFGRKLSADRQGLDKYVAARKGKP